MSDIVEVMADTIWRWMLERPNHRERDDFCDMAKCVLTALKEKGYVVVKKEADESRWRAFNDALNREYVTQASFTRAWAAAVTQAAAVEGDKPLRSEAKSLPPPLEE